MKLTSIILACMALGSAASFAEEDHSIRCDANPPGSVVIIDERLYVVVDNGLLRQEDYWQNFIHGKIELCTSHVTDMSDLFAQSPYFNYDISQWDTRRVTNMDRMFKGAKRFKQDLSNWSVEKVTRHQDFALQSGLPDYYLPQFQS
ncbi:BspA family leucine-rich repeat surface protein [Vibrio hepatarius]|uniref:BspA family leucine-rich repeat surface protein n=1 Tax=Vibrio hepatarius TaxID=171383 RepID=UPI001C0A1CFF|nr:BspA family leucine-rich repeat surface protein [Vibrio hepatarius]MBU2895216.1 DUF285 domain-containing protein [Vibrio hepatarius]